MRDWLGEWFGWEYERVGDHVRGSAGLGWVVVALGLGLGLVFGLGLVAGRGF